MSIAFWVVAAVVTLLAAAWAWTWDDRPSYDEAWAWALLENQRRDLLAESLRLCEEIERFKREMG